MSYMRSLEARLTGKNQQGLVEREIPFWEFLDIEYFPSSSMIKLSAHYTMEPSFPKLFSRLVRSPVVKRIESELKGKRSFPIQKQGWIPKDQLKFEIGATNVIYTLIDTERELLYIGEAKDLIERLSQTRDEIKHWNYFRYNVLPKGTTDSLRRELERMAIRDMAALLPNDRISDIRKIGDYKLVNKKIDK